MQTNDPPIREVVVVGAGRAGTGIALALIRGGVPTRLVTRGHKDLPKDIPTAMLADLAFPDPASTVILFTVPDRFIQETASILARRGEVTRGILAAGHVSGALPSSILRDAGLVCDVFSAHPLLAFPEAKPIKPMPEGTFVTVEGEAKAQQLGIRVFLAAGARTVPIRCKDKPLCHAAAVLCSNMPAPLLWLAADILASCGVPDAPLAATRLFCSMADNLAASCTSGAMTGPFARGDANTIALNLAALQERAPVAADLYIRLGHVLLDRLRAEGMLTEDTWTRIQRELKM